MIIEDKGSRNGTFVNEQKLSGPYHAKVGDVLRVGRLQFEVLIDHVQAGVKKPKVNDVVEAASRTAAQKSDWSDESVSDWLAEPDAGTPSAANYDTRQFTLDDTRYRMDAAHEESEESQESKTVVAGSSDSKTEPSSGIFGFKRKKKETRKLPPRSKTGAENTTDAAGEVLRRFFNQR